MRARVIPTLLLRGEGLVKTVRFEAPKYVGDPINAIKIFNDKEVDELMLLDIAASSAGTGPAFDTIERIVGECFMPISYGGGITDLEQIRRILASGVEKIVLNTAAVRVPGLISAAAGEFGSQAVVVSIDARRRLFGRYEAMVVGGKRGTGMTPTELAKRAVGEGAGEVLLNAIDRDGTMSGYDLELIAAVSSEVDVPLIASGGAGRIEHFVEARRAGAAAVAAGALFVFYGPHRAVLITYPSPQELALVP